MRKLKYHVATTVDGFIAREDGSFDFFLPEGPHIADYIETLKSYGTVLMGRRTYEIGLAAGVTDPYPFLKSYVFSRTMKQSPNDRVVLVTENAAEVVEKLKSEPGATDEDIYFCGGADLAKTLFAAGLIDEVILKVNPVLLGAGIPLVSALPSPLPLELADHKIYTNGVILATYRVKR